MDNFDTVLKELEEKLTSLNGEGQQVTQTQSQEPQKQEQQSLNEAQIQYYKGLGTQLFLSKNASLPNIQKLYPFIENYANQLLLRDLTSGNVRESYDMYLEEAKNYVLKEVVNTAKDFITYSKPKETVVAQPQQTVSYTMKDFYNDYKTNLENITVKGNTIMYNDGVQTEKGVRVFGEGKAELYTRPSAD